MARIKSDFWVSAHLRRCAGAGIDAVLRRRGAAEAGAIFVSVDHLDGTVDLYGPAPQTLVLDGEGGRVFALLLRGASPADVESRMGKEARFDPDHWMVSIDDRSGRSLLDVVGDAPG